jgi:hypothetical protein
VYYLHLDIHFKRSYAAKFVPDNGSGYITTYGQMGWAKVRRNEQGPPYCCCERFQYNMGDTGVLL